MKLTASHWAVIAAQLVTFATMIGGLQHGWHDLFTPAFVSAFLLQVGTLIFALTREPIQGRTIWTDEEREAAALAVPFVKSATR